MEPSEFEYAAKFRLFKWKAVETLSRSGSSSIHKQAPLGTRTIDESISVPTSLDDEENDASIAYAVDNTLKNRIIRESLEILRQMQNEQTLRSKIVMAKNREKSISYWTYRSKSKADIICPQPSSPAVCDRIPVIGGVQGLEHFLLQKNTEFWSIGKGLTTKLCDEDEAEDQTSEMDVPDSSTIPVADNSLNGGIPAIVPIVPSPPVIQHRRLKEIIQVKYIRVRDEGRRVGRPLAMGRRGGADKLKVPSPILNTSFIDHLLPHALPPEPPVADELLIEAALDRADRSSIPSLFVPLVLPLPRSMSWVAINDNIRCDDEPVLKYLPYFGDEDTTGIDMSGYDTSEEEPEIYCEAKEATIMTVLFKYGTYEHPIACGKGVKPKDVPLDLAGGFNFLNYMHKSESRQFYEPAEALAALREVMGCLSVAPVLKVFHRGIDALRLEVNSFTPLCMEIRAKHLESLGGEYSLAAIEGPAPFTFSNNEVHSTGLGLRSAFSYEGISDSYRQLFCRRCFVYDCRAHSIQQPLPRIREDPRPPFACPIIGLNLPMNNKLFVPEGNQNQKKRGPKAHLFASIDTLVNTADALHDDDVSLCTSEDAKSGSRKLDEGINNVVPFIDKFGSFDKYRSDIVSCFRDKTQTKPLPTQALPINTTTIAPAGAATATNATSTIAVTAPSNEPLRSIHDIPVNLYAGDLKRRGTHQAELEPVEIALLTKLGKMFGTDDTVKLSILLGTRAPREIESFFGSASIKRKMETKEKSAIEPEASSQSSENSSAQLPKAKLARKGTVRKEYLPCDHIGPCKVDNCSCLQTTGFCESFCACLKDCKHRFSGCKCKRGGCRSNMCPCFAASRECDPSLCGVCGVSIHPDDMPLAKDYLERVANGLVPGLPDQSIQYAEGTHPLEFKFCQNAVLRNGKGKKLYVGRSNIHGWGGFVGEAVEKNDFVTEYCGEIVSQDEADRRGKVYDKVDSSFLFNLNDDLVIDAMRRGNKAKFINHSEKPNCYPRIIQVNGDHRIALFSKRHISEGEELSFSYGYGNAEDRSHKPTWCPTEAASGANKHTASNGGGADIPPRRGAT